MSNEDTKKPHTPKEEPEARKISRREFAIGSMAVLGSAPAALSGDSKAPPPFKLEMSEEVKQLLVDRHILEDDLYQVITYAEETGDKLYLQDSDRFLAKLKLNTVYFYAEYSPIEGGNEIHNTYSHRFNLEGTM